MPIEMDATTRWETEAMRASGSQRSNPPRPSAKRPSQGGSTRSDIGADTRWVTLKEAEAATQIPANTIRKWIRKDTVASYLESDGQMALRMVDLDSLLDRAKALGRTVVEQETTDHRPQTTEPEPEPEPEAEAEETAELSGEAESAAPAGTMLVPIDAWNKMLNQLGNLHEAGQQLAEARERAAKAETESVFLRERLAEMRQKTTDHRPQTTEPEPSKGMDEESEGPAVEEGQEQKATDDGYADRSPRSEVRGPTGAEEGAGGISDVGDRGEQADRTSDSEQGERTTTYWRYLTTGWRDRKRRSRR
jgi:hypothetical protein